jgi:hypothetical protein
MKKFLVIFYFSLFLLIQFATNPHIVFENFEVLYFKQTTYSPI